MTDNYKLINMNDVEVEEIEWLWEGFIPLGKLTILHGDSGKGKTMAMLTDKCSRKNRIYQQRKETRKLVCSL